MNKLFTAGLIVSNAFWLNIESTQAQDITSETKKCRSAIASVEKQLKTGRQLKINISVIDKLKYYPDHPQGRPNLYGFSMSGDAARSVMSSPVLMNSLAQQIINNCNSIGAVSFNLYATGATQLHSLMPNKKVEFFKCPADYDDYVAYPRKLTWGEFCSY